MMMMTTVLKSHTVSKCNHHPNCQVFPMIQNKFDSLQTGVTDFYCINLFLTVSKRGRGRGRPPGRPRLRGRGRGRPKGRGKTTKKTSDSCLVKLELEEAPEEETTFHKTLKSPPPLQTIKKEDIMVSRMERPSNALIMVQTWTRDQFWVTRTRSSPNT